MNDNVLVEIETNVEVECPKCGAYQSLQDFQKEVPQTHVSTMYLDDNGQIQWYELSPADLDYMAERVWCPCCNRYVDTYLVEEAAEKAVAKMVEEMANERAV